MGLVPGGTVNDGGHRLTVANQAQRCIPVREPLQVLRGAPSVTSNIYSCKAIYLGLAAAIQTLDRGGDGAPGSCESRMGLG